MSRPRTPDDLPPLGPAPVHYVCASCHKEIMTVVSRKPTWKTHAFCLAMFICGLWACCFIPYCMKSCLVVRHVCPNCGAFIGDFHP